MKILITGIAGQLGNRLSELLTERRISHKGIGRTKGYTPQPKVEYLCKDLSEISTKKLKKFLSDITHVIHFADVINDSTKTNFDRAVAFYIVNKCSFSGLTES